jgi:hypothetical protein
LLLLDSPELDSLEQFFGYASIAAAPELRHFIKNPEVEIRAIEIAPRNWQLLHQQVMTA